jgi:hypothetical protein
MNNTTATKTITIHPSNVGSRKRWLHETGTELRALGLLEGVEIQFAIIRFIEDIDRAKWRDARGRLVEHIEVVLHSTVGATSWNINVTIRAVAWEMPDGNLWAVPTMSQSAPTGALHPQNRRLSRPWVRSATPVTRFAPDTPHRAA